MEVACQTRMEEGEVLLATREEGRRMVEGGGVARTKVLMALQAKVLAEPRGREAEQRTTEEATRSKEGKPLLSPCSLAYHRSRRSA